MSNLKVSTQPSASATEYGGPRDYIRVPTGVRLMDRARALRYLEECEVMLLPSDIRIDQVKKHLAELNRPVNRLRAYFGYDPRGHLDRYGNSIGVPEADPAEHEELVDFCEAVLRECDAFCDVYGHIGSPPRRADLIFDMAIEAYLAGHDAGRIERAARLLLLELPSLDDRLDKYGTTRERCSCMDKWAGRERLCKHQIAMKMLERLRKPWNAQVTTFEQPSAIADDIEIPF